MFDHELKMRRAHKHLQNLNALIGGWLEKQPYSIRYEYDAEARWTGPIPPPRTAGLPRGGSRSYLGRPVPIPWQTQSTEADVVFGRGVLTAYVTTQQPPTDPASLLVGDTLHNLRSTLDVLAFSLANGYTKPLPKELSDRSEFPIFGDEDGEGHGGVGVARFHERTKRGDPTARSGLAKIAGWHPDAQTAVERLQPYHRGNEFRSHPLWLLHDLDRVNKHRLLHVATSVSAGYGWRLIPGVSPANVRAMGPGVIEALGGPLEPDAPVVRFYGIQPVDPEADVKVEVDPALNVAFARESVGGQDKLLLPTLAEIYNYIVGTVMPTLSPFL